MALLPPLDDQGGVMRPAHLDCNVGGREVVALSQALGPRARRVATRRPGKLFSRSVIVLPEALKYDWLLVRGGADRGRSRKPLVVVILVASGNGDGSLRAQDLTCEMARGGRLLWRRVGCPSRDREGIRGSLGLQIDGEGVVSPVVHPRGGSGLFG